MSDSTGNTEGTSDNSGATDGWAASSKIIPPELIKLGVRALTLMFKKSEIPSPSDVPTAYPCDICMCFGIPYEAKTAEKLIKHINGIHHNYNYIFLCDKPGCFYITYQSPERKEHIAGHVVRNTKLACTKCDFNGSSKTILKNHNEKYHTEEAQELHGILREINGLSHLAHYQKAVLAQLKADNSVVYNSLSAARLSNAPVMIVGASPTRLLAAASLTAPPEVVAPLIASPVATFDDVILSLHDAKIAYDVEGDTSSTFKDKIADTIIYLTKMLASL